MPAPHQVSGPGYPPTPMCASCAARRAYRDGRRGDDGEVAGQAFQLQLERLLRLPQLHVLGALSLAAAGVGLQRRIDRRQGLLDLRAPTVAPPVDKRLGVGIGGGGGGLRDRSLRTNPPTFALPVARAVSRLRGAHEEAGRGVLALAISSSNAASST